VTWLALAVLSGVAGNLSYDLLKAVMRKIARRRKTLKVVSIGSTDSASGTIVIGPTIQLTLSLSDKELLQCEAYLRGYFARNRQGIEAARKIGLGRAASTRTTGTPSDKRLRPTKAQQSSSARTRTRRAPPRPRRKR
jgi:hypothetical protein